MTVKINVKGENRLQLALSDFSAKINKNITTSSRLQDNVAARVAFVAAIINTDPDSTLCTITDILNRDHTMGSHYMKKFHIAEKSGDDHSLKIMRYYKLACKCVEKVYDNTDGKVCVSTMPTNKDVIRDLSAKVSRKMNRIRSLNKKLEITRAKLSYRDKKISQLEKELSKYITLNDSKIDPELDRLKQLRKQYL